jgi:hypothetical protein
MLRTGSVLSILIITAALMAAGCTNSTNPGPAATATEAKASEHGHKPGQHGGTIVEIGRDNYHAEAVFGDNGSIQLYMLGKDEAQVHEVEAQTLTAHAKAEGDTKGVEITLKPHPRKDDSAGKTSVFAGTLPEALRDKRVEVTVPTIRIDGGRFRFAFRNYVEGQHAAMPKPAASDKVKKLYLTPGGKYTAADIKANGNTTAREKYGDELTDHDDKPQKGDKICPISKTKANPKFTWVVGGKTYEFCCPPCIDEFVKTAKEKPDRIKEPGDYVQK